jgi:HEAT repeat protein
MIARLTNIASLRWQMNKTIEQLKEELKHPRDWRVRQEAVKYLAEHNTSEAMEAIVTALYDESPHVVHSATHVLPQFGSAAIPSLLDALHSEKEIADRPFILHALRQIGDRSILPDVIALLESDDDTIRHTAIKVLIAMPDERASKLLLALLETESEFMKHTVAEALSALQAIEAVPPLIPLLYSTELMTRHSASLALGKINNDAALEALLTASKNTNGDVRYNAAEGLGITKSEQAFERLIELLKDDYGLARAMAVSALAKNFGTKAARHILALRDDPDRNVQNFLETALGAIETLDMIPVLMQRYRSEAMRSGQGLFNFAVKYWNFSKENEVAVHDAIEALQSEDENLRVAAVWLLYAFNSILWHDFIRLFEQKKNRDEYQMSELQSKVLDILVSLLDDKNPDIRLSVMEPLMRTTDKRATSGLLKCLDDEDELIVQQAAQALGTTKDEQAVPKLIEKLKSDNPITLKQCISALSQIGGDNARNALTTMLEHPNKNVRRSTAYKLGILGDKLATDAILQKLAVEEDAAVRAWYIIGIHGLKDKKAIPALVEALRNPGTETKNIRDEIRTNAVRALGAIADESSIEVLMQEIDSAAESQVRITAVEAIGKIGTARERADRLFTLLEHENETVRTSASKELGYLGSRTDDLDLRDYITQNLIGRLQDTGAGYHFSPTVADMAAKSLYYVGTSEAIEALRNWKLKNPDDEESTE